MEEEFGRWGSALTVGKRPRLVHCGVSRGVRICCDADEALPGQASLVNFEAPTRDLNVTKRSEQR